MPRPIHFLSKVWHATPLSTWTATGVCCLFLAITAATFTVAGCSTTQKGLDREQTIYQMRDDFHMVIETPQPRGHLAWRLQRRGNSQLAAPTDQ